MGEFHHVPNRQHERVELRVSYHQWWSYFQNHEVVSADLRQESGIAKQTHHYNLAEHGRMNGPESLIGNAQAKVARSLKFNAHHQSHPADFFYHFKVAECLG